MIRTILVSGASSGLGLEFVRQYALDPSNTVLAIDRQPFPRSHAKENISSYNVDVTSESSIAELVSGIRNKPIDLLIHSAGIRGLVPSVEATHPDDVAACETLEVMDAATISRTLSTNAVGSFSLIKALLPNLRRASGAKVVVMSSRMGSIGQNTSGSAYAYRASKAALNAMIMSFSIDVPEVVFVINHPGRVETGLVLCKEEGAMSVEESVSGLLPLVERWDKRDSGKFYDRFGEPILW